MTEIIGGAIPRSIRSGWASITLIVSVASQAVTARPHLTTRARVCARTARRGTGALSIWSQACRKG